MPAATPTTLYDMSAALLAHASSAVATTMGGALAREYVSIAAPAYDCNQLTVHMLVGDKAPYAPGAAPGDVMHQLRGASMNLFTWQVTALRCVHVIGEAQGSYVLPTPAQLTVDAQTVYQDGWVLWNYLSGRIRDRSLWGLYPCGDVSIGPLQPINPQGGVAGSLLQVSASVNGYAA